MDEQDGRNGGMHKTEVEVPDSGQTEHEAGSRADRPGWPQAGCAVPLDTYRGDFGSHLGSTGRLFSEHSFTGLEDFGIPCQSVTQREPHASRMHCLFCNSARRFERRDGFRFTDLITGEFICTEAREGNPRRPMAPVGAGRKYMTLSPPC